MKVPGYVQTVQMICSLILSQFFIVLHWHIIKQFFCMPLHLFPHCPPPVFLAKQLWQQCEWNWVWERVTLNRNSHHALSPRRVTLKGDLLHTWIVSVVPPHSPTRHGTPTSIWHLSSVRFPWEAKGLSVCYFQTRKSCWCACVRQNCSRKLSQ